MPLNELLRSLTSGNPDARANAAKELGRLGDNEAVPALIAALDDHAQLVRLMAAQALGELRDPRAVKPLIKAMEREEGYDRGFAIIVLGLIGDFQATQVLIHELSGGDSDIVDSASEALGLLRDPASLAPMLQMLGCGPISSRRGAAYVLGELRDSRAIDALAEALRIPRVGWAACRALAKICDPRASTVLVDALRNPQPEVREYGAKGLEISTAAEAVPALAVAVQDPDPRVRRGAAAALAAINDSRGNEALVAAFSRSDVDSVAGSYQFFLRRGIAGSEGILIEALALSANVWMANCFVQSGNEKLKQAAEAWEQEHGVRSRVGTGKTPRWGSEAADE